MDRTRQVKTNVIILLHALIFKLVSSHLNLPNASTGRGLVGVEGQPMVPSWYQASVGPEGKHGTVSPHSHNRWRTQMDFHKTVYSFQVKEDTVPGTVVGKVESLFESLRPLTLSVQEDDGDNLFLLNPISGEFLLSRSLDFETQRFYILTVELQQGDSQVSSVRVYFNVLDVNDNPPVFSQESLTVSLLEDSATGTCFLFFNVTDMDEGENGEVKLRLVSGDEESSFFVQSTGHLCLSKDLDRERQSFYNLTVTANDCAQPVSLQLTSTANIFVIVEDVNDNSPLFMSPQSVSIPEDTALHSVIMTVRAEDEDVGPNGEVWYHLSRTHNGAFSINNTSGNVYLEQVLDRELEDTLIITITATDKGFPQMTSTMNFTLYIEDINDNDPQLLESNYSLSVREDISRGTSLFRVQAHDQDIGHNGQVRYMLTPAGPFVVDAVRGLVSVMAPLDREKASNYSFIIKVVDQGTVPRSTTASVSITVLDINDFAPYFVPQTLIIHVKENEEELSQLTKQVAALDEDLGMNSQLTYFLEKGDRGLFSVSPDGVFHILHSLDREKQSLYMVTITAVDSGLPPLNGTLTIQVMVEDVNDNYPEFSEEVYHTIVVEDSPEGTVFLMVTASDVDEGVNGQIRYFIEDLEVPFAIGETTGELFTTNLLDREAVSIYILTLIASDEHPTQPLSSSVLVTVLIGDINDHWPQFKNSPYVTYVPAELAAGSVICAVKATDEDTEMNAELHYSLSGHNSDLFSIENSGTVFTSSTIQNMEDIVINVHVEDNGENPKSDTTTVSVRFQNISDFPEMKVDFLSSSLSEDEPVGSLVALVSAVSIRAEPISLYIAAGNFEDIFHVDQFSGALTLEKSLDYENRQEFTLLIEARDSGSPPFSSFLEVRLNVTDVNDNYPQFTQAEYRCEIYENLPPSTFCDVFAVDADSLSFSVVRYGIIEGNSEEYFTIDPDSGLLSTTVSLDRETIAVYTLTVEAVESDNPLHKDSAKIILIILDKNDNPPQFSQTYFAQVSEDVPVGHTVIQVTSTDDDSNSVITYSILGQSEAAPFTINFRTGWITAERLLDREAQDHYILKIHANDSTWSVSTNVTIIISDVNDNSPTFIDQIFTAVLTETKEEDAFVLQVLATDADIGKNSDIFYIIDPPSEEFWINSSSGAIFSQQTLLLHHSHFKVFQFTVLAFDCGRVSFTSNATVEVRLEKVNQHPPVFWPIPPLIAIPSHLPVGTEIMQLIATDLDVNGSASNDYYSQGGNASDFFWIESSSGRVFLTQTLAGRENSVLHLFVIAVDQGFPPLTSQTKITFDITEINRFSPSFSEPDVTFSVPEDMPVGSVIGRIQAEDRDYGRNGAIIYHVVHEFPYSPMSVGETTGLLTLVVELDFEKERMYNFPIKAADGGWISKTSILNVTLLVMDINDNAPLFLLSEYTALVPENSEIGTVVLNAIATDMDSGTNAQISYSLVAGHVEKFSIDAESGTIKTLDVFDFEMEQMFDLTVKASNPGRHALFSLAHVVILVKDVNEFIPMFGKEEFHFSVLSNVPIGTQIGNVTAVDYDQGSEGQVFYLLFGHSRNRGFYIDSLSGKIHTSSSLRNQGSDEVVLKVLAKNSGVITGMDEDETLVHISVIDINEAPMFTSLCYNANVTEDSPPGASVLTVSASDLDSTLDWNHFFFSIENGNTNFSFTIDPLSGVISVNSQLDRELWSVYNLTVAAIDNGSPPATGTTNVIVTIGDVNDNAPILTSNEAQVMENQPEGTVVTRLNAFDSDLPPNQGPFTYWLLNQSLSSEFLLTADGVLLTTKSLDREHISAYRVLVVVEDAGFPIPLSSTTTIHIKVLDENDNPPLPRNIFIEVKYFGSSFQGGMIGNVHPEDHDEFDTFSCVIRSGPVNMFAIPNGTCELWSSPFQGEATFNVTVEAADELQFTVNNSIYVNYKGFTNASINSCILFYVSLSSMEEFLSNKYLRFVKALDSLFNLQASKTHVFGIKQIGKEILLLAAVKNYNGQYLSKEVASGISTGHKKSLEAQSNVTISHITSDPCITNPCQNKATCSKNIYISQEVAVLESMAVIFVSPQKEIFNCTCPSGFSGPFCEDDIDECEVNPCKNNGTCENTPGGFICHCPTGFSGTFCSADVDECLRLKCQNGGTCVASDNGSYCHCVPGFEGEICEEPVDHCRSTPCVEGTCINLSTGFFCNCPFGVSGVHCEEHSYGFEELSFMEFPPLDRRTNLIYIEFATVQKNSLILYNPGGSSSRDFFALEIVEGSMQLSYDLGSGPVKLKTHKHIADGFFHSVTARRIGNMGSMLVDNCTDVIKRGFCFSKSEGTISERTLDVGNNNMTFGGLRTLESILLHPNQIKSHDFVGCIRQVHINGILLRPSMALAAFNIYDRCTRVSGSVCDNVPCKNGGVCHDFWSDYLCDCPSPFGGINCATVMSENMVMQFSKRDYVEYVVKERFKRDYLLKGLVDERKGNSTNQTEITIKFKTKEDDGVLFLVLGQKSDIILMIREKKPVYVFKDRSSGHVSEFTADLQVADGVWHVLTLSSEGPSSSLSVDSKLVFNSTERSMDLTPINVEKIIVGAAPTREPHLEQLGFSGCVQYFNITGYNLPISGHSTTVGVRPSSTLSQPSCGSSGVCLPSSCSKENSGGRTRLMCGPNPVISALKSSVAASPFGSQLWFFL
ncbi:hypothetical protein OJAV_G00132020 [Oryzias javanicus]|uniref:Protocadherin Fat 4-like n=1 Tax=Oryzias javanicus TaxID=123683 RepID=A0A3S2PMR1_ORYJA|nr:hypothetical protein OJAV_G00132020 [Oryzias javanicus]